ncbi:hypothetical protein EVAR_37491_1 [Eumeta japonica]|uniref:Uncharacterized protein n=1 Tax=Eumeta variegata TaxID=151549 RepID=A0A4C1XE38_EUMVA|nr:hypothetical protein EVAR_37491_1 [Eumeta japonica]
MLSLCRRRVNNRRARGRTGARTLRTEGRGRVLTAGGDARRSSARSPERDWRAKRNSLSCVPNSWRHRLLSLLSDSFMSNTNINSDDISQARRRVIAAAAPPARPRARTERAHAPHDGFVRCDRTGIGSLKLI